MSVRIFADIEEALSREVRRITFHQARTRDEVALEDTYDPFTGEVVSAPVEANFYDSSADTNHTQYPHFFIRLMKTKEDLTTGRSVSQYGKWVEGTLVNAPGAYQIVVSSADALILNPGNELVTTIFQIGKVQPGYLIRILSGNNKGTYIVDSVTISNIGDHIITVSNIIVNNLPISLFDSTTRTVKFTSGVDLSTVKIGDVYTDAGSSVFNITSVDANTGSIVIDGTGTPNLAIASNISRPGNVFLNTDLSPIRYLVMDPSKPITTVIGCGGTEVNQTTVVGTSPPIPLDLYYLIRIDSKERQNHIQVLNRMWEEFNPPRTALPVIQRSSLSAEQILTQNIPTGGSDVVNVGNNTNFSVGDSVFIFDDLSPTKRVDGEGFQRPFSTTVIAKLSTTQLQLADVVPDTYTTANTTKIVSNASYELLMFHFMDHVTKDVEGAQYWVHEFTFWVQAFIDRLEQPKEWDAITGIDSDVDEI